MPLVLNHIDCLTMNENHELKSFWTNYHLSGEFAILAIEGHLLTVNLNSRQTVLCNYYQYSLRLNCRRQASLIVHSVVHLHYQDFHDL